MKNDSHIIRGGRTATLKEARRHYTCNECHGHIFPNYTYWSIVYNGSGITGLKHPDRVCVMCLDKAMPPETTDAKV